MPPPADPIADAAVDLVAELSDVPLPPAASRAWRRLRDELQVLQAGGGERLTRCQRCGQVGHQRTSCPRPRR